MAADADRIQRTAHLIERLLGDPLLRRRFRARPAEVLDEHGLGDLVPALDGLPFQTLDVRESRSSLAGALMAAAAEGIAFLDLVQTAHAAPPSDGALAIKHAATHAGIQLAVHERPSDQPRQAPSASPRAPASRSGVVPAASASAPPASGVVPVAHRDANGSSAQAPAIAPADGRSGGSSVEVVLHDSRVELTPAAAADLRAGVDPRVAAVLERLARDHRIRVSVIRTGHDRLVAGTNRVSNHFVGRAFDIAAVDGERVSPSSAAAHDVATALLQLPQHVRPDEVGSPWRFSAAGSFSDRAHQDHIHVGWDQPAPDRRPSAPERVPEPSRARQAPSRLPSGVVVSPVSRRGSGHHDVRAIRVIRRDQNPVADGGVDGVHGAATPYAEQIDAAARRHNVDPNLLRGLIRQESNFNPHARSPAGAIGLCQLMPDTARGLGVDPTDVNQNIEGGAKYLARLLHRYDGDQRLALAAYNAGEGRVAQYGGIPPFAETRNYIEKVLAYAAEYRRRTPGADRSLDDAPAKPTAPREAFTSGQVPQPRRSGKYAAVAAAADSTPAPSQDLAVRMLEIARREIGQHEVSTDDSPRIAYYRSAVPGSGVGPWCSYFVSWVAKRAGHPLGDHHAGFGLVSDVWHWAASHGHAMPASGYTPHPGDLILFGGNAGHIGIVERVLPDGRIQTIEGNHSDQVAEVLRGPHEASGYVRMT